MTADPPSREAGALPGGAGPAAPPERPARQSVVSERARFWSRTLRGWDIAFYLMAAIGAVSLAIDGATELASWIALSALGVLVVTYATLGRRAARIGSRALARTYLVVLVVATVTIVRLDPAGAVLLFIAYSQVWFFSESRRAGIATCAVLTVGVFGAMALAEGLGSVDLPGAVAQGALTLAFAVLLGLWVTQVAEQSEGRAELLVQLEEAQVEIGRSHHAAGVAAERQRMAQEIHDTLAQGFTSIVMLSQTAEADLRRGNPQRAADRVALIERTARDNLAEARALVAAFAPVGLQDATLGEALERLAQRFEHETGVRVGVVLPDEGILRSIGREREVILLRAAQEALANVRRHAQARHVQLVLGGVVEDDDHEGATGRSIQLEVVDDGRGIGAAAAEGIGLRGMRDRVTSGGGELEVSSGAQGGTRVRVALPEVEPADPADPHATPSHQHHEQED